MQSKRIFLIENKLKTSDYGSKDLGIVLVYMGF
jgi:hypothetical protein